MLLPLMLAGAPLFTLRQQPLMLLIYLQRIECRELCTRSVRCAGEAAELAAPETARVIALMDQGLVSCVLDCEANAGGEKTEEVRACARSPSCEKFGECVHQF